MIQLDGGDILIGSQSKLLQPIEGTKTRKLPQPQAFVAEVLPLPGRKQKLLELKVFCDLFIFVVVLIIIFCCYRSAQRKMQLACYTYQVLFQVCLLLLAVV